MKKKILVLLVAAWMFVGLPACGSTNTDSTVPEDSSAPTESSVSTVPEDSSDPTESSTGSETMSFETFNGPTEKVKIPTSLKLAFVGENIANTSSYVGSETFKSICDTLGYEWQIFDGAGQAEKQMQCILDAISWGAEAIICSSCDESAVQQGIKAAYDAGIPIVGVSNGTDDPNPRIKLPEGQIPYLYDVAPDYYSLGYLEAQAIFDDSYGEGIVAVFDNTGVSSVEMHSQGLRAGLDDLGIEYEVIMFSYEQVGDTLDRMVTGYLQSHPKTTYVSIPADPFAISVVRAIDAAGFQGIKVCSVLGTADFCALIDEGTSAWCSAAYDSVYMVYGTMDQLFRYMQGGDGALWSPRGENTALGIVTSENLPDGKFGWSAPFDYVSEYYALWEQE